jgi:glycerol uptake facilitator-like aquaporin
MRDAIARHWPEYLIEAGGLGLFMLSACAFATLMEHPASPVRQAIADAMLRRVPMGLAMGLTAIGLIYSPFGQRSGAHFNPAVTSTFFRLGKVARWDYALYVVAQCVGGLVGIAVAAALLADLDRPARLQQAAIAAINAHRVPPALQEPLLSKVNGLAASPTPARARALGAWLRGNSD